MNGARFGLGRSVRLGTVVALLTLAALASGSVAQTPVSGGGDESHPAHIHAGTCEALGEVVVPLADVAQVEGEQAGASTATTPKISLNLIDMPIDELLAGEFAVNIHQSADEIDTYIACGDIGGVTVEGEHRDAEIRFVVHERNGSGHTGIVFLGSEGDQTELNILLIEPEARS